MKDKSILSGFIKAIISSIMIFLMFWFMLPAINLRSTHFWSFIITSIIIVYAVNFFASLKDFIVVVLNGGVITDFYKKKKLNLTKSIKVLIIIILSVIALSVLANIIGAQLFNASRYKNLITMADGDFTKDISELSMTQIPVVDKDTASRLGKRKLGEMSDLVSQFEIEEDYTQINYHNTPVRVTPLKYGDTIKWFKNQKSGLPAYIMVDMVTQDTTLVRLDKGIKYSPSEYFMRDLNRYLRFKYPTKIFDEVSFEIDEDGMPYWVASTITYRIGLWSGKDVEGAVLLNAITGESTYYDVTDIPVWVDQVYPSYLVVEHLNYNGKYRSGYWNAIFVQSGVLQTTDGYNYLAIGDDVCLYTGMTSVVSDESNVGFVLVNLRTKETGYYSVPGAEEYSAMGSAEGQVQHLGYNSTFPLLLNVADRPTYFMSLKDDAGLVKMYAFVDVEQYQVVGTGSTVPEARSAYIKKLSEENIEIDDEKEAEEVSTISGIIEAIYSAVVEGNTRYYFKLAGDYAIYIADISVSSELPFYKTGDQIKVEYTEEEEDTVRAVSSVTTIALRESTEE